jgi:hypothetical protein
MSARNLLLFLYYIITILTESINDAHRFSSITHE